MLAVGVVAGDERARVRVTRALDADRLVPAAFAASAEELLEPGALDRLDAVVLALDHAPDGEEDAIRALREQFSGGIVAVAPEAPQRAVRAALEAGADAFVVEATAPHCLALAIRSSCAGQLSLPRDYRRQMERPLLSMREKQILGMVVLGFTNGEIARKLFLAESTVKSHLSSAFAKLGARSRKEAVALILDPDRGLGTGILAISEQDRHEGVEPRAAGRGATTISETRRPRR